jgi:uncharacterized protein with ATP-grasp and redox domains
MPNPSTESPSPAQPIPSPGSNGLEDETENDQPSYPRKYKLEDFSQQAINSGQQEINYLMTEVDEKIVAALKEFSTVIARLASPGQVNWSALDNAVEEVSKATKKVASIFPPGCGNPSP